MPGILHGSACFLFLFGGCNRIKGCQQQGGPLSHLCYQQYVCVCNYYWRVFKLEDILCIEVISGTLFDHDIQTACARTVSALHAKKPIACPQEKKIHTEKICTICIFKQRPLSCIIMMETQKNRSPIKLSYYTSDCQ